MRTGAVIRILGVFLTAAIAGCSWTSGESDRLPRPCNDDGICDENELGLWCEDCRPNCVRLEGQEYEYIVDEIHIPTNATEARTIALDLDGDGEVDNKLGQVLSLLPADEDPNVSTAEAIARGRFIMLGRLRVDEGFPATDESVGFQLLPGDTEFGDATEDNLTGTGTAVVAESADRNKWFCGTVTGNYLEADGVDIPVKLPLFARLSGRPVPLELVWARAASMGTVDADGWEDIIVGGALVLEQVMPALARYLSREVRRDPDGTMAVFVDEYIDGHCSRGFPGCSNVVPGVGACARWTGPGDPKPPVSATEIKCNRLMRLSLKPDLDVDGDGNGDLLSFGFMVSAISVTFRN